MIRSPLPQPSPLTHTLLQYDLPRVPTEHFLAILPLKESIRDRKKKDPREGVRPVIFFPSTFIHSSWMGVRLEPLSSHRDLCASATRRSPRMSLARMNMIILGATIQRELGIIFCQHHRPSEHFENLVRDAFPDRLEHRDQSSLC
jgi:hypothetical protein